ncbi:Uncharacterized protein TCM_039415 [Theobroma cacao]|uniref:Uncharacterized protein n=1 Tax=Theobroma cacao TaxID=3641 RepID=A0A061GS53_THECC|nr:Uncharacterized protein TCM_039415 [Theobroma cacao]
MEENSLGDPPLSNRNVGVKSDVKEDKEVTSDQDNVEAKGEIIEEEGLNDDFKPITRGLRIRVAREKGVNFINANGLRENNVEPNMVDMDTKTDEDIRGVAFQPAGFSGGIWFLWDNVYVGVEILAYSSQMVYAMIVLSYQAILRIMTVQVDPSNDDEDVGYWMLTSSRMFSVKTTYEVHIDNETPRIFYMPSRIVDPQGYYGYNAVQVLLMIKLEDKFSNLFSL